MNDCDFSVYEPDFVVLKLNKKQKKIRRQIESEFICVSSSFIRDMCTRVNFGTYYIRSLVVTNQYHETIN